MLSLVTNCGDSLPHVRPIIKLIFSYRQAIALTNIKHNNRNNDNRFNNNEYSNK